MKKRIILPVAMIVLGEAFVAPTVSATGVENVRLGVNESVYSTVFSTIDLGTRELGFQFNQFQELGIAISELYVADYNEEEYTTRMVEEQLDELGTDPAQDPSWAKSVAWVKLAKLFGASSSTKIMMSRTPELLTNRPGVIYYAMKTFKKTNPDQPIWYRGKIDYRACVRGGKEEVEGTQHVCKGRLINDGKEMMFVRADTGETGGEGAVSWEEEWGEELKGRLESLAGEIATWEGDEEQKAEIEAKIAKIAMLAEDAVDTEAVFEKTEETRELIVAREKFLNGELEEKPEEEKPKPTEPEQGEQGGMGLVTGGRPSGSNTVNKVETETKEPAAQPEAGKGEVAVTPVKKPIVVVTQTGTDVKVAKPLQIATRLEPEVTEQDQEKAEVTEEKEATVGKIEPEQETLEVPRLSEEKGWKWHYWLILAGAIGVLGTIIWWCKRAFSQKKR